MAEFGGFCEGDKECVGSLICFRDVSWAERAGFVNSSFCACDAGYGHVFDEETSSCKLGPGTVFALVLQFLQAALALGLLIFLAWGFVNVAFARRFRSNATLTTSIFCAITIAAVFMWKVVMIVFLFTPNDANGFETRAGVQDIKTHKLFGLISVFIAISAMFAVLSFMNLGLMMLAIASRSKKLNKKTLKNITGYKRHLILLELLWAVVVLSLASLGHLALLAVSTFVPTLIIIITFTVGRSRMKSLLSHQSGSKEDPDQTKFNNLIGRITRVTLFVVINALLMVVSTLGFAILTLNNSNREKIPVDRSVQPLAMFGEGVPIFLLIALAFVVRFCIKSLLPNKFGSEFNSNFSSTPSKDGSFSNFTAPNLQFSSIEEMI